MPWLVGTALIHSLAATEKRGVFKHWTILLAISAFSLSLLGTFLVRSGVLTSVHAFATDPSRGVFILIYLAIVIGGSLTLFAFRAPATRGGGAFKLVSRESFLLVNNILLAVSTASVLLGTLYPLVLEALGQGKVSVGPPYFNAVFVPLMVLVALFQVVGAVSFWKQDRAARLFQQLRLYAIISVVAALIFFIALRDGTALRASLGLLLGVWIFAGGMGIVFKQLRRAGLPPSRFYKLSRSFLGMSLAHIGIGVTIIGVTLSSLYSSDSHNKMSPGESVTLRDYQFYFDRLEIRQGPNYESHTAVIEVTQNGKAVATLLPEKRIYQVRNMPMTEAGIDPGFTRDLYVSLGEPLGGEAWSLRVYHKPFVRWIWLGAIFMAMGGLLVILDPRYRISKLASAKMADGDTTLNKTLRRRLSQDA